MARWSNERTNTVVNNDTYQLTIRCRTTDIMLGTMPGDPDIYRTYVASKAPDAATMEEEIANSSVDDVVEKGITVFPTGIFFKTPDNVFYDPKFGTVPEEIEGEYVTCPFIWEHQWKGCFKESIAHIARAAEKVAGKSTVKKSEAADDAEETPVEDKPKRRGRKPKAAVAVEKDVSDLERIMPKQKYHCSTIKAYKKVVDGNIFIKNKRTPILVPETYIDDMGVERSTYITEEDGRKHLRVFTRPLRAETMQGPRVTLAASEFIPAGAEFYCTIQMLDPSLKPAIIECLDLKQFVGMLQWRSGGKGTLVWTPADENGVPIDEIP